jgi:preprotein translocase subunit SecF
MHIFKNPQFDFVRWRWHALVLSWVVILAGLFTIYTRGIPLGVEFSGGTIVITQFSGAPPSIEAVRAALPGGGRDAVVQQYGNPALHEISIRVPDVGQEAGTGLSKTAEDVQSGLKKANFGSFTVVGTQIVGPVVGSELTRKGTLAMVLSLVGLLIYIAFRFRFSFAVGAVVATIHDLLVTFAFLAFFKVDLSLNVIAAILTMSGYSTNDTIVIFDRVREDARLLRNTPIKDVMNRAVNQTLNRTVITSGTALLSVIALYLFGGEVLRGLAFTMIVGIITGTYSSVFIAGTVVTFWKRAPARATAAVAAGQAAATQPARAARSKPQRRKRA